MSVQAAMLRGVNLGSRKVVMSELRTLCQTACGGAAKTLLASGNVVVDAKLTGEKLEKNLEAAIAKGLGLKTDVFVRNGAELDAAIAANPFTEFAKKDPSRLQIFFLGEQPSATEKQAIEAGQAGSEAARVVGREVFVTFPDGIARSKWKLKTKAASTARNWNTVTKLAALMREIEKGARQSE